MKTPGNQTRVLALMLTLIGIFSGSIKAFAETDTGSSNIQGVQSVMKIKVTANDLSTVYELNSSQASRDLYEQLPLKIKIEDYSNNEKIFYPPNELSVRDTPLAGAQAGGVLAYYAPWGDVVMFYAGFGRASGLYELGQAILGGENIHRMNGTASIEKHLAE